jgi:hypothetical protein
MGEAPHVEGTQEEHHIEGDIKEYKPYGGGAYGYLYGYKG